LANEVTDWIAIGMSAASLGFSGFALFYSTRKQEKAKLDDDQIEFLHEGLRSDQISRLRGELYDRFCSAGGDPQALGKDPQYYNTVRLLQERYDNIAYDLKLRPSFTDLFNDGDWAAILKCDKAFANNYRSPDFENLVNLAKQHLRNVKINIDPCKK
jgi:hypothetical protein